jgi:pyruvate,water dikinase
VVTDGGGYLAHAVIVARDFGIPAVIGTQEATRKIKDGQRIKVDGNLLRVYIFED